jgi:hypothetical protein
MHRFSDLDYVNIHFQELYAEAERYRQIKNSKQFEPVRVSRWVAQIGERLSIWVARLQCRLQERLPRNLFSSFPNLGLKPGPCTCTPEPCTE